ncbi:hypothetical protein CKM354_001198800 [Cercospora kikuchii]|uniref:Uncharacterized protein n=1 Tax=Cercospora kikuchii TaxID=84275 RepID=A0A9P3FLE1_9PEZI|nr:uncharacterized protein CKM354_001198800 [Cercospora kikuchii]GIZ48945.1 hypothetical protein CKM354_001198800 [Cercospora kikuchii]
MTDEHKLQDSPGHDYLPLPISMKVPHMDFIYRLSCDMAAENHPVGAPFDGSHRRVIMPIEGGSVKGPGISATIQHMSGADWGTQVAGTEYMRLDARYTLKTDDGHFIYVRSKGIFSPREDDFFAKGEPDQMTQSDVEWFTRLQFDAGPGPYNWLNGIMAIGVLSMHDRKIIIDAYRVTNFPGLPAKDIRIKAKA